MQAAQHVIDKCKSNLKFKSTKSSGPGGQHVNKTETKVVLTWNILSDIDLDDKTKQVLLKKLSSFISKDGLFQLSDQSSRSQKKNKSSVIEKWESKIIKALKPIKKRKRTKPSKQSKLKAKELKKKHSVKKESRKKIILSKYS